MVKRHQKHLNNNFNATCRNGERSMPRCSMQRAAMANTACCIYKHNVLR